jgi:hypothetical protein
MAKPSFALDCFAFSGPGELSGGTERGAAVKGLEALKSLFSFRENAYGNDDLFSTGETKRGSDMRQSVASADKSHPIAQ